MHFSITQDLRQILAWELGCTKVFDSENHAGESSIEDGKASNVLLVDGYLRSKHRPLSLLFDVNGLRSAQALIIMQTFDDVKFISREVKLIYGKKTRENFFGHAV